MADLDNTVKFKLEALLGMGGGYVLDFSNARFGDFVKTAIGIDPYERYDYGSKASLLRRIWHDEPIGRVAKLNLDLLEHWRVSKLVSGEPITPSDTTLHEELVSTFTPLARAGLTKADTEFLEKDFGAIDLSLLPRALSAREVVEARLSEIDLCLNAGAPLAVIFLVGSTLEGLLLDVAMANPSLFTAAAAAPKSKGQVQPLDQWRLANLIAVGGELGVLGSDVVRFADHVRAYRNYIHPRQQLTEGFEPRIETARIAQHVLLAALADLQRSS